MDDFLSPTALTASPYSKKQICDVFFKPILDDNEDVTGYYRCRCGAQRKQDAKRGYTNLISYIYSQHPDYERTLDSFRGGSNGTLLSYVDKKSANIFGWIEWLVCANLPLSFCENALTQRYTSLEPVCDDTVLLYMTAVHMEALRVISDYLPANFGIVFDGWSFKSEHYLAVFAAFGHDGKQETVLLAMAPLLDVDESSSDPRHGADAHIACLKAILKPVKRHIECVRFLVEDNCSVNISIAKKLKIPMVGCASHRLNLAMTMYLETYGDVLDKINDLMKFLRGLTQSAKLRQKTSLRPVIRQATRWSSTFAMVERFFKLKPFLDTADDDLAAYLPSPLEERQLREALEDLKDFESVSKKLQQESGLTMADARTLFDSLMEKGPSLGGYLAPQAPIVKFAAFEKACVQVQNGQWLSHDGRAALAPFLVKSTSSPAAPGSHNASKKLSFAERSLKSRRVDSQHQPRYELVHHIPPTSNLAERFFSQAGIVLSPLRQAMGPEHLETILFLKLNRRFWNLNTVRTVGKRI